MQMHLEHARKRNCESFLSFDNAPCRSNAANIRAQLLSRWMGRSIVVEVTTFCAGNEISPMPCTNEVQAGYAYAPQILSRSIMQDSILYKSLDLAYQIRGRTWVSNPLANLSWGFNPNESFCFSAGICVSWRSCI